MYVFCPFTGLGLDANAENWLFCTKALNYTLQLCFSILKLKKKKKRDHCSKSLVISYVL